MQLVQQDREQLHSRPKSNCAKNFPGTSIAQPQATQNNRSRIINAYNRAVRLHSSGQVRRSLAWYRRALSLDPKLAKAWHNYGSALNEIGETKISISCYLKALECDPSDYRSLYNLFLCYQHQGEFEKALDIFRRALPYGMNDWKLWNNLGVLYRDAGKPDQAEVCLRQAQAIENNNPIIYYNLGIVAQKNACYLKGLSYYYKALKADPDYAPARWLYLLSLPMIYDHQGQVTRCRRRFAANLEELAASVDLESQEGRRKALEGLEVTSNFFLQYQGQNDCKLLQVWGKLVCRLTTCMLLSTLI